MLTLFRELFAPPRHMILLIIAAWIGLLFAERRTERHGVEKAHINNILFYGILAFIVGGRVSFILQNISIFSKTPLSAFSINPDLFDSLGGIAAAFIFGLIHGQRKQLPFWNVLDALTPFFAILAIGLGLSHLAAGTAFGKETSLPWGINLWNAVRHPTQIYEALASTLTFILLWPKKHDSRPGLLFLTFAALTAASQLFIQAFRGDGTFILTNLRQGQVGSWGVLLLCFILFEIRYNQLEKQSPVE
ncbi:MAG: prolipoprotein diacylglyceryl transferase [Chloroflexi bacterium]|nr:prolipoprotein diacylglyceryl transferase [Chloroflexota bacterium]